MHTFFLFCIIIAIAGSFSLLLKRNLAYTLSTSVFSIIIILYYTYLVLGTFVVGYYVVLATGVVSLVVLAVYFFRQEKKARREILCQPFWMIMLVSICLIYLLNKDRMFIAWDEFSHWGLAAKNMVVSDKYSDYSLSTIFFDNYPPGISIFIYFVEKFYGVYREAYAYRAINLIYVSICLGFVGTCSWEKKKEAVCRFVIILLIPLIFFSKGHGNYLIGLQVDPIISYISAYLIYLSFEEQRDRYFYYMLIVGGGVLCLTKEIGIVFALFAVAGVLFSDLLKKQKGTKGKSIKLDIVSLICVLLTYFSWEMFKHIKGITSPVASNSVDYSSISDFLLGRSSEYQREISEIFFKSLGQRSIGSNILQMSAATWLIAAGILFVFLYNVAKNDKAKLRITFITQLFNSIVFIVGMLIFYCFKVSAVEAQELSGFERFISTPIVAMLIVEIQLLLNFIFAKKIEKIELVLILCLCLLIPFDSFVSIGVTQSNSVGFRKRYNVESIVKQLNPEKDKVAIVSQGSGGLNKWILHYEFTPINTTLQTYYNLSAITDGDDSTSDLSPDEWIDTLINDNCNYVYLDIIDQKFCEAYGQCFDSDIIQGACYYLNKNSRKLILKCSNIE